MSDTDVDPGLDPSNFILHEQRSSMAHAMSSLADDPEKAARSVELGDATGDKPVLIYGNLENYEEQHKAALTASLLTSNKYLRQYVDADPMHAKISNDDYGNLDSVSEQLKKLSLPMRILRLPEAGGSIFSGAWEGFKKGFGDSPSGSWLTDKDIKEHKLGSAVAATLALPVEGVLRFGSGILEGAKEGVKEGAKAGYQQLTGDEQGAEQFSRDLASMVEQYMMGTSGVHAPHVPDVKFSDAAIKIRPIIEKASPWLDESREPPRGLDPEIDKLKFEQNKIDLGNLDEALKAAQGSATRERSPEIFASFIRQHSDASIGISGDAVAKLYGSRVPEAGDNILGWSPRIAEELRAAVATGGDVQVPLADWLAKVDPEVEKELHDDIRVRPGGITKNEKVAEIEAKEGLAEPPKPAEIIPEPLPSVRGASGLEPMFSIGDRKLTLEKQPGKEPSLDDPTIESDRFNIMDENGLRRGFVRVVPFNNGKRLYVDNIGGMKGANMFGPALTRDLARQLKEHYPEAEEIGGFRISGARERAGTEKEIWIKFDELEGSQGWTKAEALHNLLNPTTVDVGKGGILHYSPEFAPYEAQADKIIRDTLAKIAPDAQVFTPSHIEVPGRPSAIRGGFMQPLLKQNPWIVVALDAGDTLGVARHEAVHYLKQFGFFKEGEWETLSRAAREQDWVKKFGIDRRYPNLDMPRKLEEAIAEGYRNWLRGEEVSPRLHPIFERLKELFESLKSQLKELLGREPTWEELFQKMDTGEVGAREPRGHAGGAFLEPSMMEGEEPMFDKAAAVGMTADQFKRYMKLIEQRHTEDLAAAQVRAEKEQAKRLTKEWKDNEKQVRQDVSDSIRQRPDVAADLFFGAGELYGNKISSRIKIGEGFITPEQRAKLPKDYVSKSGVNPDDFAGVFGYTSGDALINKLGEYNEVKLQAGMSAKDFVKRTTDLEVGRQMQIKYGSLEKSVLEEAQDQATSETQINILHEETLALALRNNAEASISKDEIRSWVKGEFANMKIGSISLDSYMTAMGKAGRAAEMALLKEDFAEAFRAKQQQYVGMLYAREAKQLEKEMGQFDRTAKRMAKQKIDSIEQEYTDFVHVVLQQVGRGIQRSVQNLEKSIAQRPYKTLVDFVEAKEQDYRIIPVASFLADPNFHKSFENLTTTEFRAVKDTIDTLVKQGRDEKKLIREGESADRQQLIGEMKNELVTFPLKTYSMKEPSSVIKLLKQYSASATAPETFLNRWDRDNPRGPFNQWLVRPMSEAANRESRLGREYSQPYKALGKIENGNKLVDTPLIDPLSGKPYLDFNRKNLLAVLQNYGNAYNWHVLTKGLNADSAAVRDWLFANTTKADWDRAQKLGDIFSDIFGKAETVYRNVTGVAPERIPIKSIDTPFGQYKGWYHPLMYDPIREGPSKKLMGGDPLESQGRFYASVANGYVQRRTGYVAPLDLTFDRVPSKMSEMLHDIAFRQAIIESQKIIYDKDLRKTIVQHYSDLHRDELTDWLKGVAGNSSSNSRAQMAGARVSEYLRQNVISTYIGYNVYTALKHAPTAAVLSMRQVGPVNFLKAVTDLYGKSEEIGVSNAEYAMKWSEELQRREKHWQDTIAGEHKEIQGEGTLRESMIEKGSWLVAQSDMLSAKPMWVAAYRNGKEAGLDHGQAIYEADQAVRFAHGSTARTNLPGLVRGGGALHGWLTTLYGFFGTMMQRRIELAYQMNDIYKLGREGEIKQAAANVPTLLTNVFTYVIWPTLVEEWVTGLNQDDRRGFGQRLLSASSLGIASSFLYLRDIVHGIATSHEPSVGLISGALHDVNNLFRDVSKGKQMFSKEHAGKTVQDAITVFGEATGMAPKEIGNAARFGIDLATGKAKPKSATDYARGFTRGTTEKHVHQ